MFKSDANEIFKIESDQKIGGKFSILERAENGEIIDHFGTYEQIIRPIRLEFMLEAPKHFQGVTRVKIYIKPEAGGCVLVLSKPVLRQKLLMPTGGIR